MLRLLAGGLLVAAAAWAAGWTVERGRFGADEAASLVRLEAEVNAQFAALSARLDRAVRAVDASAQTVRASEQGDSAATRALFDQVSGGALAGGAGVTVSIYGFTNQPVAWTGRLPRCPTRGCRIRLPSSWRPAPRDFAWCASSR